MNSSEVMALSIETLRVKAAELDGWEYVEIRDGKLTGTSSDLDDAANWVYVLVPDYPNDIMAALGLYTTEDDSRQEALYNALVEITGDSHPGYLLLFEQKHTAKILTQASILAASRGGLPCRYRF